ncbi:MAG: hypothetical protein U5K76_04645 [Woeseiaceae bacterium]|nr:hypothetical protein [Woeseiaceae bacterium]
MIEAAHNVALLRGDAVRPEAIHWLLVAAAVAACKLHIVAGAPGLPGKSTLAIALAATPDQRRTAGRTARPANPAT